MEKCLEAFRSISVPFHLSPLPPPNSQGLIITPGLFADQQQTKHSQDKKTISISFLTHGNWGGEGGILDFFFFGDASPFAKRILGGKKKLGMHLVHYITFLLHCEGFFVCPGSKQSKRRKKPYRFGGLEGGPTLRMYIPFTYRDTCGIHHLEG
jgi:hypothetical protein